MSLTVLLAGPNTCLSFSMCNAYADLGLFGLIYLQCSVNCVCRSLEVCPIHLRPHVWHKISYLPLFPTTKCVGL
jgi:hypothetical protein